MTEYCVHFVAHKYLLCFKLGAARFNINVEGIIRRTELFGLSLTLKSLLTIHTSKMANA